MRAINCDLFVLIFIVILNYTLAYKNYSLDSSDVCSPNTKRRLKLGSFAKSGIILTQKLLGNHALEWRVDSKCKFEVKVDQGSQRDAGIFVVIQNLELRMDDETGECIDYVQFKRRDGHVSRKYCGKIDANVAMQQPPPSSEEFSVDYYDAASNSFIDPDGEVDVYVVVAKQALMNFEKTDIVIAFTKYKPCSKAASVDRPCDNDVRDTCIPLGFFGDGIVNCPNYNCLDEGGCYDHDEPKSSGRDSIGNKVLIGSVTSLLLMFGLFICCIYVCRKYGALCWSDEFSRPSLSTTVTVNPSNNRSSCAGDPAESATLPVPATAPVPPGEDKDLPPSYDSLFPTR